MTRMENRANSRAVIDRYHSIELSVGDLETSYQFKIRDLSPEGLGILIREDSALINHIKVGTVLHVKYRPVESKAPVETKKTEIKHITKNDTGAYGGHYTVGLTVL
jgi:hypothetical protein